MPTIDCRLINIIKYCFRYLRDLFSFRTLLYAKKAPYTYIPNVMMMDDDVIPWLKPSEKIERRNNKKNSIRIIFILFLIKYIPR